MSQPLNRLFKIASLSVLLSALVACESDNNTVETAETNPVSVIEQDVAKDDVEALVTADEQSYSNFLDVRLTHLELNLAVDFADKALEGFVDLDFERLNKAATTLVLDTRDLVIDKVELEVDGQWVATDFTLSERDDVKGSALTIALNAESSKARVYYASQPQASGLQWLTPEQTAGKKHPFMYSQAQAIHARSFIPVQDTPAVRVTYNANIKTPKNLLAVMSAFNEPDTELDGDYHFEMPQAIPPYLIAIAAGDLAFQSMSERTAVYAEPALLQSAVDEFNDTEQMIVLTEEMFGPYRWGRYDLLILPPSFPFGGMENPRLSFITPTVIAGDKSLVNLIAHELAHSWSGNLVTNATWRDLWLNEGFTSYVENRIMEELFGEARATMEQSLDVQGLKGSIKNLPVGDTILHLDLNGRDPDDAFSSVPYTKGQMFLVFMEQQFGRERFDVFLRQYFDDHAFQSLTTPEFKVYLKKHLLDKYPDVVSQEQIDTWLHQPNLPEMMPNPTSDAFTVVDESTKQWLNGVTTIEALGTDSWTIHEWLHFLNNLPKDISLEKMVELDKAFALTDSTNNEVAHAWLLLALQRDYKAVMPRLEQYLNTIGRRKLIVPLYKELMNSDEGAVFAKAVYAKSRSGYHPLAQGTIDAIVK